MLENDVEPSLWKNTTFEKFPGRRACSSSKSKTHCQSMSVCFLSEGRLNPYLCVAEAEPSNHCHKGRNDSYIGRFELRIHRKQSSSFFHEVDGRVGQITILTTSKGNISLPLREAPQVYTSTASSQQKNSTFWDIRPEPGQLFCVARRQYFVIYRKE